ILSPIFSLVYLSLPLWSVNHEDFSFAFTRPRDIMIPAREGGGIQGFLTKPADPRRASWRRPMRLVLAAAAALLAASPALAVEPLRVGLDQTARIRLAGVARDVVVANPGVADVT